MDDTISGNKENCFMDFSSFEENQTTNRTNRNVKKTLEYSLISKYNIDNKDITEKILLIHGLAKNQFDFVGLVGKMITEKINDISIDDNANKNEKTIEGIVQEVTAPIKKSVGYDFLYQTMKKLYGKDEAKRLSGELYDMSLAISDSVKLLVPYCWAFDASKIVMEGRPFGQLRSKPPKRIESYIAALNETVHQLSNHLAGAVAIGTLFFDLAHILSIREGFTLEQVKTNIELRKRVENVLQTFVHSINHLSRNAVESPFTNVSVFDRVKLEFLIKEMYWYFNLMQEDGTISEEMTNYYVEYVMTLQEIFLDYFDKGDPSKNGMPYRFPVCTLNISKKKRGDDWVIEDKVFLNDMCKRDIYRYNIFTSEGVKISSCCRLINNREMLELASSVNSFGGSGISLGSHRVVTINFNRIALESDSVQKYFDILKKRISDTIKILYAHKELIMTTKSHGLQMFLSNNWIRMDRMFSTIGMLGIVEASINLIKKFGEHDYIKDILSFANQEMSSIQAQYIEEGKSIILNLEQIPAESMAKRLPQIDKLIFPDEEIPILYSNQFIPLWEKASVWDRMEADGKYNTLITGGGIAHIQIAEKVTPTQAEKLIRHAVKVGNEHFALNAVYTEFEDGEYLMGKYEVHPISGSPAKDYLTRVVGFFTPISSWNKERREWEFPRRTFNGID